MFNFNVILTELCNANCSHCYMAGNKSKKTIKKEEIIKIIENMPNNTKSVVLTGGEIFLVEDLLIFTIKLLKEKFNSIIIGLESNGIILYKDMEKAKVKLKYLKKIGVNFIRFSDDLFHEMGGVDLERARKLKRFEVEVGLEIKYLVQNTAVAIGKAESLDYKYKEKKNCMNNGKSVINPYLFLDVKGNVFICTWKCIPSLGNMIDDLWYVIVDNLNSEFNQLVLSGKIEQAINSLESIEGLKNDNVKYSRKFGQCVLCYKKFLN